MSSTSPANPHLQIINAPSRTPALGAKSIFLAGTTSPTSTGDWRLELLALLSSSLSLSPSASSSSSSTSSAPIPTPLTIYNPLRPDWDATWREDINFAPYREQVEWELDMQEAADIVVVYFHPETKAPISLLELGLCARREGRGKGGGVVVVCPEGYWKRGNVQIVCRRFGVQIVDDVRALRDAVMERVAGGVSDAS
ncbi:hypothetical protein F4777DRAFT_445876 [Nemania sp. FL0916]|nr:hypothetical protein F4777DRAFT_445876 [Nemania sp. FL0916]